MPYCHAPRVLTVCTQWRGIVGICIMISMSIWEGSILPTLSHCHISSLKSQSWIIILFQPCLLSASPPWQNHFRWRAKISTSVRLSQAYKALSLWIKSHIPCFLINYEEEPGNSVALLKAVGLVNDRRTGGEKLLDMTNHLDPGITRVFAAFSDTNPLPSPHHTVLE